MSANNTPTDEATLGNNEAHHDFLLQNTMAYVLYTRWLVTHLVRLRVSLDYTDSDDS